MEVSLESSTTPGDELRCTIPEETTGFCNRLIPRLPPYDIARYIRLPQVSVLWNKNNTVKKRNNKHEINLLWLGTRRANFSLSGLLLALLSFRISVTRLCLLLQAEGKVVQSKFSKTLGLQTEMLGLPSWLISLVALFPCPFWNCQWPSSFLLWWDFKLERHSTRGGLVNSFSMASTSARALWAKATQCNTL